MTCPGTYVKILETCGGQSVILAKTFLNALPPSLNVFREDGGSLCCVRVLAVYIYMYIYNIIILLYIIILMWLVFSHSFVNYFG